MKPINLFTLIFVGFYLFYTNNAIAQTKLLQNLSGSVIDRSVKAPLKGASIELLSNSNFTTASDNSGNFKFDAVPIGKHTLRISYIGYKTVTLSNLSIESGKQFFITVEMEEEVTSDKEIIIKSIILLWI
jgi:hypothetical protein